MAKKRNRAISLSLDWDSMVKEGEESEKGSKAHLAGTITYDRETVEFCTGSSYTGKWNALGMAIYGNYFYPHGMWIISDKKTYCMVPLFPFYANMEKNVWCNEYLVVLYFRKLQSVKNLRKWQAFVLRKFCDDRAIESLRTARSHSFQTHKHLSGKFP